MIPILQKNHKFTGNPNILLYNSFLTEEIIHDCYSIIRSYINKHRLNNNKYSPSSNQIILINTKYPTLFNKLVLLLQQKITFNKDDLTLYFNIMTKNSAISEHRDEHLKFSITIYLNQHWQQDFGGIFHFTTDNNVQKTFVPTFNDLIILTNTPHSVSKTITDQLRITIQGGCKNNIYYKNEIVDNHFFHFTNS